MKFKLRKMLFMATSLLFGGGLLLFTNSAVFAASISVFSTDFNAGVPAVFSGIRTTEGVQGYTGVGTGSNVFSGNFLRNTTGGNPASKTILTLTGLAPHNSIDISFLLAIIDSWDGGTGNASPDIFNVAVDGKVIFSESFTNISYAHSASYPRLTTRAGVVLIKEKQLGFNLGNSWFNDSAYNMGLEPTFKNIPHTSSTITIEWFASASGWQGGSDESWAIDNVEVSLLPAITANAGSDQTAECAGPSGASVTLNGSAPSDSDNDPLTYTWTWAGGSAEGVSPTVSLPLGTTTVTLTVSDGKATSTDTVNITVSDTTPPVTTATGGSENWYNANVISTFSASDSCSGVKEVRYSVDGSKTVVSGSYASATITTEGTHTVTYYSIDNAGNVESSKSMIVKIDKTPPTLNLSTNPNTLWPPNHKMVDVTIGGGASDNFSGVTAVAFTVKDEYGIVQPSISSFNSSIALEAWRNGNDKDGRHYTITATATDAAGNKSTASTEVLVPHDQR